MDSQTAHNCTGCGVIIKGADTIDLNAPFWPRTHLDQGCNSLFITHLPPLLTKRPWEKLQAPVLLMQTAVLVCKSSLTLKAMTEPGAKW